MGVYNGCEDDFVLYNSYTWLLAFSLKVALFFFSPCYCFTFTFSQGASFAALKSRAVARASMLLMFLGVLSAIYVLFQPPLHYSVTFSGTVG